ncbi:hypothetical protein CRENBAI_002100 [Crenichthys baileyi]|uniref:Uncharacterized protein n=1 Tax=Crenichthys baileyi TaxID=28760 RepID=A0AAV9R5C2_9TELE
MGLMAHTGSNPNGSAYKELQDMHLSPDDPTMNGPVSCLRSGKPSSIHFEENITSQTNQSPQFTLELRACGQTPCSFPRTPLSEQVCLPGGPARSPTLFHGLSDFGPPEKTFLEQTSALTTILPAFLSDQHRAPGSAPKPVPIPDSASVFNKHRLQLFWLSALGSACGSGKLPPICQNLSSQRDPSRKHHAQGATFGSVPLNSNMTPFDVPCSTQQNFTSQRLEPTYGIHPRTHTPSPSRRVSHHPQPARGPVNQSSPPSPTRFGQGSSPTPEYYSGEIVRWWWVPVTMLDLFLVRSPHSFPDNSAGSLVVRLLQGKALRCL